MSAASLLAYASILPKLPAKRRAVFEVIAAADFPVTCRQVAKALGMERDCVSPRIGELLNIGAIEEVWGRVDGCQTVYRVNPEPPLFWEAPKKKKRPLYKKAIEEAAKEVEEFLANYPVDVFSEPDPGKHGATVDSCSARALRVILPNVAKAIRELAK